MVIGDDLATLLPWCAAAIGAVTVLSVQSKQHGGHESSTYRLQSATGFCYLKVHRSRTHWHNEVHAYTHWARAFGNQAPRLLAVHDTEPLALVISEVTGQIVETAQLSLTQARSVWRDAGAALVALHDLEIGPGFGPCFRGDPCADGGAAAEYIEAKLKQQIERAVAGSYLHAGELPLLEAALAHVSVFAGEHPVPCHRDYCTANWLVNPDGRWCGVIDFEFAYWDVRVADFCRDPEWTWMRRPDLVDAYFDGYGRPSTPHKAQQLFVARAEYALGAILWGCDHAFFGFAREGHTALAFLASQPLI